MPPLPPDPRPRLPPGQQLVAPGKWPVIGERLPAQVDRPWSLTITGEVERPRTWTLEALRELPQTALTIDIHCVTRWSKFDASFVGVRLTDLLEASGATKSARFISFVARSSRGHSTSLALSDAIALGTLIALEYDGQPLEIGHGGPIRNIVPGRYFYKSVKWLERMDVLAEDRLGMWEAESGYHNHADPWLEERYMSPTLDKRTAARLIESRDFTDQDLRSIDASDRELSGLKARGAMLRDAKFERANLSDADFEAANLSNSHFGLANLQGANFRNADIEGADFSGADLRGVDFSGASLIGASFFTDSTDVGGSRIDARIDGTTTLPESTLAPLFPAQLDFVRSVLRTS